MRAWHGLDQFRGEAAFGTWLHRLAVNVLLRELERNRRHLADDALLGTLAAENKSTGDPDLERALATLPAGLREVVVLHDMESYTHDEGGYLFAGDRTSALIHFRRSLAISPHNSNVRRMVEKLEDSRQPLRFRPAAAVERLPAEQHAGDSLPEACHR